MKTGIFSQYICLQKNLMHYNKIEFSTTSMQPKLYIRVDLLTKSVSGLSKCYFVANQTEDCGPSDANIVYQPDNAIFQPCEEYVFDDSVFTSTAVTDFGLFCNRHHYKSMVGSVNMIMYGSGATILGFVSDHIGRKKVIALSILVSGCFQTLASFMPSFPAFCVCHFCRL